MLCTFGLLVAPSAGALPGERALPGILGPLVAPSAGALLVLLVLVVLNRAARLVAVIGGWPWFVVANSARLDRAALKC